MHLTALVLATLMGNLTSGPLASINRLPSQFLWKNISMECTTEINGGV